MVVPTLYKSEVWQSLHIDMKADLLFVIEGIKNGAIIQVSNEAIRHIAHATGLAYSITTHPLLLNPMAEVAYPDNLGSYHLEMFRCPAHSTRSDFHLIRGRFLGYPDCCTKDYVDDNYFRDASPAYQKEAMDGKEYLLYRFGFELEELIRDTGTYPDIFDYMPHGFVPCSITCPNAIKMLISYKEVLERLDPKTARSLVLFCRSEEPRIHAYQAEMDAIIHKQYLQHELDLICGRTRDTMFKLDF